MQHLAKQPILTSFYVSVLFTKERFHLQRFLISMKFTDFGGVEFPHARSSTPLDRIWLRKVETNTEVNIIQCDWSLLEHV